MRRANKKHVRYWKITRVNREFILAVKFPSPDRSIQKQVARYYVIRNARGRKDARKVRS